MAVSAAARKWKEQREISPERTKVWTEPVSHKSKSCRKVPVVYYLCRSGQLEHPHFIEVPLSSPEGLYLRDVIDRLNFLRGKGMASMYSWSAKRSYKNGFVWHDLAENDFIFPAHGQEYVLKGSELLDTVFVDSVPSSASKNLLSLPPPAYRTGEDLDFPARRRRNQSCSSIDIDVQEYSVYKAESSGRAAADASTQTDDKQRRRRRAIREEHEIVPEQPSKEPKEKEPYGNQSREEIEISPPPSDSSPETLETLIKSDGRLILRPETIKEDQTVSNGHRSKASSVLMQLISCGAVSFKDCGPGQGFNLISQYKLRMPRGGVIGGSGKVKLEEKAYFSGSLVETKKEEFPALKRSSSYNADRISQMEFPLENANGASAKCIQSKQKTTQSQPQQEPSQ